MPALLMIFLIYCLVQYKGKVTVGEVRHIGFLKVHKAGGTTIQNILFRFGVKRNLSFVIPEMPAKYKLSDYGQPPNKILKNRRGKYYDILAIHSVYVESVYASLLPNDTVNIAIVRNPLELMVSAAFYHRDIGDMHYLKRVPKKNFIRNLILFPELYDKDILSWTRNSMAMDFGFAKDLHVTDTHGIKKYLSYLSQKFRLVMIMERFDESLVLLKRLLHWDLADILYTPINVHKHPPKDSLNLTSSDVSKFEIRNFLDVEIYRHFLGIFEDHVERGGKDLQEEVRHFQVVLAKVSNFCSSDEDQKLPIESSDWNKAFTVSRSFDCVLMNLGELKFIDLIRNKW